jgi:hypothetical protein
LSASKQQRAGLWHINGHQSTSFSTAIESNPQEANALACRPFGFYNVARMPYFFSISIILLAV